LINTPGEYERKGIHIRGIKSFHDDSEGAERGLNTIYVIKTEDMAVCHLGDFGQKALTDKQVSDIGDIDILMIPVGGTYTIGSKEAVAVIGRTNPKIVIPMHYKVSNLKLKIDAPNAFIKEIGLTPEKVDKFRISKKLLPVEETKLVIFK
jgi:L-ascorbate metabolism protein UlaG (beta-lactamase superfamily)